MKPMMKVDEWNRKNLLTIAFENGLSYMSTPRTYFFDHIYAPIRLPTGSGMPDSYTYLDIGFSYSEIASIYAAKFGGCYWPEWYKDSTEFAAAVAEYRSKIVERLISVLRENEYKYNKLIELQGFAWNPLWNVDGTELHATIEQHAKETVSTGTNLTVERSAYPYDSASAKKQYQDKTSGSAAQNTRETAHTQDAHSVAAEDNAFGEALSGGDIYHAEKTVRQGNIGVTKSSELIRDARGILRWSILEEYFRDINKVILIGIF